MLRNATAIIGFILGTILLGPCYGQDKKAQKSATFKDLTSRSKTIYPSSLLKEANDLKQSNPSSALDKVQEALGLSIAQQDELSEAKCYVLIGEINEGISEWKLALENYQQAYRKFDGLYTNTSEYKRTLAGLGTSNLMLENFDDALIYLQEALETSKNSKVSADQSYHFDRVIDLSELYYRQGNYNEALKVLDEVPTANQWISSSLPAYSVRLENQKAKIYAQQKDFEKSKDTYSKSLSSFRANKAQDPQENQSLQTTKDEIANVLREQNRYGDEIKLRNQAVEFNLESKNMSEVTKDKVEISKTLEASGDNMAAIKEIEEAAIIADTLDDPKQQANAFLALAQLYEKNGRNLQALAAYRKYSKAVSGTEKKYQEQLNQRSELIEKQKDIDEYTKDVSLGQKEDTIERATFFRQQLIIYGLLLIILIVMITSWFIYRSAQASKIANQLLALKSLRGQMNPHFIFNALNSVNHFVAQQDERTANRFLSEFSQLMRLVLENSQQDFISLHKEQEILSLYLKLEHYRFRDKFDYDIVLDEEINGDAIEVPPMLIQPYLENAVWHGLRYRESKGKLILRFYKESENLVVEITDDGIGRQKSAELKTENQKKHNSTGLKNIQERLIILNKVYKANYQVAIEDLPEGRGTRVKIFLPVTSKQKAA